MTKKWYIILRQTHPVQKTEWVIYRSLNEAEIKNIKEVKKFWYNSFTKTPNTNHNYDYECKIMEIYE